MTEQIALNLKKRMEWLNNLVHGKRAGKEVTVGDDGEGLLIMIWKKLIGVLFILFHNWRIRKHRIKILNYFKMQSEFIPHTEPASGNLYGE